MKYDKLLKLASNYEHLSKKLAKDDVIDLSNIDDFSLSSVLREMRKQSPKLVKDFLRLYNNLFVIALQSNFDNQKVILDIALKIFSTKSNIQLSNKINKTAQSNDIGNPILVGKYLSNIIKFVMNKISNKNRPKSLNRLKHKLFNLNEAELSNKKMPKSASIGQAITFVKHILFNQDSHYIRKVINTIIQEL